MSVRGLTVDEGTSRRMAGQAFRDTSAEMTVRRMAHSLGYRYRVQNRDLPGSPDLANRSRAWAVFVHGCFWHHHEGCGRATVPKRNRSFWLDKFEANRARDRRVIQRLRRRGMTVLVVWECELTTPTRVEGRLRRFFQGLIRARRTD